MAMRSPLTTPSDYTGPGRTYNLRALHGNETALGRYMRLTVGENAGLWTLIWHELVLGSLTGLPGVLGIGVRNICYSRLFRGFHRKAYIGRHVTLRCPRHILCSSGVVIDDFVQLVATSSVDDAIRIGQGTMIRSYAMLNAGPPEGFIHTGAGCTIGQGSVLYGSGGLSIGNNVLIAGQCFIVASSHQMENPNVPVAEQGYTARGIIIKDNVWIGAGAKILDGITIGEGAVIGANAVVNRSIRAGMRVGGVPARPLRQARKNDR